MGDIPSQYQTEGYRTVYGDAEARQAIANVEVSNKLGGTSGGGITQAQVQAAIEAAANLNLPTKGANTAANSLPVTLANDGIFATSFGLPNNAAANSDGAIASFISLFKYFLGRVTTLIDRVIDTRDRLMPNGTTTPYLGTSNGALLKSSAGNIYAITCSNNNANTRYFQVFNQTTAPANNDVPVRSFPVTPDDSLFMLGQDIIGGNGIILTTGIAWGFSSTRLTYTAATATDCIATVRWA